MISGDGLFSHICVGFNDISAAKKFYDAALSALGIENLGILGEACIQYGIDKPGFLVLKPADGRPASVANGGTVGFAASDKAAVAAFHAAGLANGGTDDGEPGPRWLEGSFAAYLRDPAGNKICAYTFD